MNTFGLILVGVVARTTVLALVGLVASRALKRRGPSAGALASLTTLAVLLGVAGLALSPWPRWWSPGEVASSGPIAAEVPKTPPPEASDAVQAGPASQVVPKSKAPGDLTTATWADFVREFNRELSGKPVDRSLDWRWPAWVACAFLAGLAVALGRLGLGFWAVRGLRARGRAIDDPGLLALVAGLRDEMGLVRPVEVREAAEVGTPATVGWRRPAILLPEDWTEWDAPQRRAVLAHELAHILRGDYPAGIAAQLSLSVHFYHPLVHALAGRLRLQQELAADAWGARVSGGRRAYLTALATLALRQGPRPSAWPARPFLPTRGTFLRRIEMLRDPNALRQSPLNRPTRAITVAALILIGLMVAGFRGPTGPALAQEPSKPKAVGVIDTNTPPPLEPTSAASDVHFALDVRPSSLLKNRDLRRVVDQVMPTLPPFVKILASGEIDQVLVLGFEPKEPPNRHQMIPSQVAVYLRSSRPSDWKPFLGEMKEFKDGDVSYFRSGNNPNETCLRILDDRTLLMGSAADVQVPPLGNDRPRGRQPWVEAWKKLTPGPARVAFDTSWMVRQFGPGLAPGGPGPFSPILSLFGPLLDKSQAYGLTLDAADGLAFDALAACASDQDADRVADTVRAALALSKNALPDLHLAAEKGPREVARPLVDLVEALDVMLAATKIDQAQTVVNLHAKLGATAFSTAIKLLVPAAQAQQEASKRMICVNHQKQIGLAMHNYHAAFDCFPPAVLYGPDGKTPHSWRVAILPYLEEAGLYSQYKMDEPWDGPNNKKLIDKMPAMFSCPDCDPASLRSGYTSYFVLAGPETMFPARKEGTKIQEVTDGTSHTILVVEAKREIPWTKPEDIPFEKDKLLPEMGGFHPGGSNISFADGAVRFVSHSIDKITLRALITRNGGEVVSIDRQ